MASPAAPRSTPAASCRRTDVQRSARIYREIKGSDPLGRRARVRPALPPLREKVAGGAGRMLGFAPCAAATIAEDPEVDRPARPLIRQLR